ncbi:MAG: hypothetical protein ACRECH_15525, partial [Nitrososphaerales archaeon]
VLSHSGIGHAISRGGEPTFTDVLMSSISGRLAPIESGDTKKCPYSGCDYRCFSKNTMLEHMEKCPARLRK